MAGMSVDGLVSGLDTTNLINQLVSAEGAGQAALKTRLKTTESAASAYRTVNTTFLAITSATAALQKPESWAATKALSSSSSTTVTATAGAPAGSLTFAVKTLASPHGVVNKAATGTPWTSATSAYGASSIEVFDAAGVSRGTLPIGGTQTLADAAAAINADTKFGLSASVVQVREGTSPEFVLQVTSKKSGTDSRFSLGGAGTFTATATGTDAELRIGGATDATGYSVFSPTNTFDKVMGGVSLTVNKVDAPVTVTVSSDPDAVAAKVQSLVDAVNAAIQTVDDYTDNSKGSTKALRGDFSVGQLAGQLLEAVSTAVGDKISPAQAGFSLTKDGKVAFAKTTFLTALKDKPDLAKQIVLGSPATKDADGKDVAAVTGIAARLAKVATSASDATTGTLVAMANGQDSTVADLKTRIEAWDLRLEKRREALTRQFTAMETALSSLKNQSTWLGGQLSALG